jgi:CelD/BcsL family acetyltransferase involved in cellulose biosynthesis
MPARPTLTGNPSASPGNDTAADSLSSQHALRYSIEKITSLEELSNIKSDWNRLSESAPSPNVFMTHGWFQAWMGRVMEETRSGTRPNVLVLKTEGAVAGVAPLICRNVSRFGLGARKLEFVTRQADYNDLVLGFDPVVQTNAIVEYLARTQDQWDLVELRDLRDMNSTLAPFENALSSAGLTYRVIPEEERCPYLTIDAPWPELLARRSPSTRHGFHNQQSRLNRMHPEGLRIRIIENPLDEPALLEKLIALESQKHVDGKLSPPVIGKYSEVFQSLFETLGPRGWLYVALMELGDRPIAWRLGFRCGKKLWGFLTAYDHGYSHLSPGTMLMPSVVDYGFSHGYNEYDFLRGEESYKSRWSTGVHQSYWLRIWSRSWISRAHAFFHLDVRPKVKRLLRRQN